MSTRGENSVYNLRNQIVKKKNKFLTFEWNTFCILEKKNIVTGKQIDIPDFYNKYDNKCMIIIDMIIKL